MTQIDRGWGADPSQRYDELASRFRPLFQRIRAGAVECELARRLPLEELKQLKQSGFGALRVPAADGGAGASLRELFDLLIELSEADSNLTQGLRGHFGFTEDVVNSTDQARRDLWFPRLVRGDIVGNAWSEVGEASSTAFSTRVTRHGGTLRLNGEKYYTTAPSTPTGSMLVPQTRMVRVSVPLSRATPAVCWWWMTGMASARS
jgi:alkylation response protein AidB-like acyl-CoA dehydrogenase